MPVSRDLEFKDVSGLLSPKSIVVIGASGRAGNVGGDTVRRLKTFGFPGPVYVINRSGEPVEGVTAYTSLADLPTVPDLAVLGIPAEGVTDAVRELAALGTKFGIAYAGGFAEGGGKGVELQRELVAACSETGFNLCGPNCVGIINASIPATPTFATALHGVERLEAGIISMVSQSGGIGTATMTMARRAGFPFRHFISSGNEAIVSFADYLNAFVEDDGTKIIAGYIEGIANGPKFIAALKNARAKGKSVVLIKSGATEASAKAAGAHTGSIVGKDSVFDAVLQELGVIRVGSIGELLDTLVLLVSTRNRLPQGPGVGIVTFGGGSGVLATDQCAAAGLITPALTDETTTSVEPLLVSIATASNPLDLTPAMAFQPEALARIPQVLDHLAAQPGIDTVLFHCGSMAAQSKAIAAIMMSAADRLKKPFAVSWQSAPEGIPELLATHDVYAFPEPDRAIKAIGRLWKSSQAPARTSVPASSKATMDWAGLVSDTAPSFVVPEDRTHAVMKAAGLKVAEAGLARSEAEALALASRMPNGVAMKGITPAVTHRAAAGLLAIGLRSPEEVSAAWKRLNARADALTVKLDGVYVQEMHAEGVELLVSGFRDPVFGVMIACGAGGGLTELIADVITVRAPVDPATAASVIDRLRIRNLQKGLPLPLSPSDPAAQFVADFSQLCVSAPWQSFTFEVNPIKWTAQNAIAVDGLIVVDEA
ncbi:MAG TPA: acetate--CoA ligase family protein [Devosiaceae bacterium]|jgi:acetyltransferase